METRVNPACVNASNPFHACAEYCAQRAHGSKPQNILPKLVVASQNGEGRKEDRGIVATQKDVDPSCRNASNPFHQCAEYCSAKTPEMVKGQRDEKRSVDMVQNGEKHKEDQGIVVSERNINPLCKNASNPYHLCGEYCYSTKPEVKLQNKEKKSGQNGFKIENSKMVSPKCTNSSNPYHVCAENTCGGKSVVTAHHVEKRGLKTAERDIHPNCANASNPYHKCGEYCFQKINQSK
ncbi:hypothetical protein Cni_G14224 [Canna indica]|uniref:Uncharacterized protein n=1 Tax=Canna indica TaxID=4628 RepID=A0AAQ3KDQ9_9LILI|nr:hypothetical protein Cni_G14224 [Canna indica]